MINIPHYIPPQGKKRSNMEHSPCRKQTQKGIFGLKTVKLDSLGKEKER